ncbi:MAG: hypothetical protein QM650_04060 [Microlunatus sp.]
MNLAIWTAVAIPVMLGFAPITQAGTTKIDTKQLDKLRGSVRLPLPDQLRERVIARIRSTERLALWGAVIGLAILALLAVILEFGDGTGPLVLLGVGVGGGIGSAIGILTVALTVDPQAQRIARSTAVESADYVAPRTIALSRVLLVIACLATGLGVLAMVGGQLPFREGLAFVLLPFVGTVLCHAAFEILIRLVTERAQRAASELELAWDDVLRAHGLRQTVTGSVVVSGACAVSVALGMISVGAAAPQWLIVSSVLLGTIGLVIGVTAMIMIMSEPAYRVLQQLWPRADFGFGPEPRSR